MTSAEGKVVGLVVRADAHDVYRWQLALHFCRFFNGAGFAFGRVTAHGVDHRIDLGVVEHRRNWPSYLRQRDFFDLSETAGLDRHCCCWSICLCLFCAGLFPVAYIVFVFAGAALGQFVINTLVLPDDEID